MENIKKYSFRWLSKWKSFLDFGYYSPIEIPHILVSVDWVLHFLNNSAYHGTEWLKIKVKFNRTFDFLTGHCCFYCICLSIFSIWHIWFFCLLTESIFYLTHKCTIILLYVLVLSMTNDCDVINVIAHAGNRTRDLFCVLWSPFIINSISYWDIVKILHTLYMPFNRITIVLQFSV